MTYDNDKQIDHLLSLRAPVSAPEGMAQRIINMAQPRKPKDDSWAAIWTDIQMMFVIPRPAYALAAAALFGLLIGFDVASASADPVYGNFVSFLSADAGDMDEGSWL